MAIVVYKCDVCKREIELQQNIKGVETIQRCKITHGCRGKLRQIDNLPDYIRGSLPDSVVGLENWRQRRVLYNHTQSIEKQEWTITHNLGTFPTYSVFVDRPTEDDLDNREEISPTEVEIVDENTLILKFDRVWSGIAQLVARSSDPQLLQPVIREIEEPTPALQLTNNGEVTIITKIVNGEPATVNIVVSHDMPTGAVLESTYVADNQPSLDSAWSDYDKVVIRGKLYTVRSFNIRVPEMAVGDITNGANFRFLTIDGNPIEPTDALILLAAPPFEIYDKITAEVIDVTAVTETENPFSFYYDNGEWFAEQTVLTSIYPPVRSA